MKRTPHAAAPRIDPGGAPRSEEDLIVIPEADGAPECLAFVPPGFPNGEGARLTICVHGISRDHREQITLLRDEALGRGQVLIAPHFGPRGWSDYQRLGRRGRGPRADLALERAIDRLEVAIGVRFRDRFMIGYSGGAQFAHRYAMAHPERLAAVVCAAAGWYTQPDPGRRYPHGLRVEGALSGVRLDPASFLRLPMLIAVGRNDTGREAMRSTARLDARQGHSRVERARRWTNAMRRAAERRGLSARIELALIDGAGHAFSECVAGGLGRLAFEFFDAIDDTRESHR